MTDYANNNSVTLLNPEGLYDPSSYGYSHLSIVPSGSRLVFVAGQDGETIEAGYPPDFGEQARQAFTNLATALKGANPSV